MKFFITILCIGLSACSTLRRSPYSGYDKTENSYENASTDAPPESTTDETANDHNLVENDKLVYDNRMYRIGLEKRINDPEEKRQYIQFKNLMNENEKIQFLQLPDIYARDRWLDENGFANPEKRHSREIASIIEKNDIALGMNALAVKDSWGDPDVVEVAGNPNNGNERWKFIESIGTPDGFKVEERILYFEHGLLIGWETKK